MNGRCSATPPPGPLSRSRLLPGFFLTVIAHPFRFPIRVVQLWRVTGMVCHLKESEQHFLLCWKLSCYNRFTTLCFWMPIVSMYDPKIA